jgi:FKBP-type peptidyl-prolyl cis-trans isomerase FkpA
MGHKEDGEKFLADNAKNDGVKVTASGLQYRVITEGTGEKPKASSEVTVHYRGTLINGVEFDSSYKRGETISFPLNRVIAGWTEGLQLMTVGSKYEFTIPYALAYGDRGTPGGPIPGYATLIFEVELFGFK